MPTTTQEQLFPVPVSTDDPNIPDDLLTLANAIERRVVGVYNNATDRNTKVTSPQEGQFAYLKDTNVLWYYDGAAWTTAIPVLPAFSSGTAVPSNSSGANGDVFFKV